MVLRFICCIVFSCLFITLVISEAESNYCPKEYNLLSIGKHSFALCLQPPSHNLDLIF